jgi:hypothetical protein
MSVAEAAASTRRDVVTLVAGQVDSPVNQGEGFDQPATSPRSNANPAGNFSPGSFSMYSRAADRVEVATAVTLGRSLDARA